MSLSTLKKFTEKIYEGFMKLVSNVNKEAFGQLLVLGMAAASCLFPKMAPAFNCASYLIPYISIILVCLWNWYQNRGDCPPM